MTEKEARIQYLIALQDSRRDPALLTPARLAAAYNTQPRPDVSFELWAARMGFADDLQKEVETRKAEEQARFDQELETFAASLMAGGADFVSVKKNG